MRPLHDDLGYSNDGWFLWCTGARLTEAPFGTREEAIDYALKRLSSNDSSMSVIRDARAALKWAQEQGR